MMSMYRLAQIKTLVAQGLNNSQIAKTLDIDRKTVRKYRRRLDIAPSYKKREISTRMDPAKDFEAMIHESLSKKSDISGHALHSVLRSRGYAGSQRTVERRIRAYHDQFTPKERFFQQKYEPGEQSQYDFKESVDIPFIDGVKRCHLLFATLPYSGAFFVKSSHRKTFEAFMEGMQSFFEWVGGHTKNIRIDNLSPLVAKVGKGQQRIYTKSFERVLNYYQFGVLPCRPGKGSDKGDVERDIRTHAKRICDLIAIEDKKFKDLTDFNQWLFEYVKNNQPVRQENLFAEEKLKLLPSPPRDDAVICKVLEQTVNKHGTVRLENSAYSVPDQCIGTRVKITVYADTVKVYAISGCQELIVTHKRMLKGENSILLEHTLGSLVRKPQAMVRWAHKHILFPRPILSDYYEMLRQKVPHCAESEYLKSINLIQHFSIDDLCAGVHLLTENHDQVQVSFFHSLKKLLEGDSVTSSLEDRSKRSETLCQTPLTICLSVYDGLIPP